MARAGLTPQTVPDDAYNATSWNGNLEVPTKNAVRDKIESMGGAGDVVGPASATNNAVPLFDLTTGKLIKNSTLVYTSNNLSGVGFIGGNAVPAGDFLGTSDTQVVTNKNFATGNTFPAASASVVGDVELATTAETTTGTDATRAVTPDGLHDMTSLAGAAWFKDEDAMSSNSDTTVPSQQSVKAYVDSGTVAFTNKTIDATATGNTVSNVSSFRGNRQSNTTNTTTNAQRMETGFGFQVGNSTVDISKTVTFSSAFTAAPVVICTAIGYGSTTFNLATTTAWGGITWAAKSTTTTFSAIGRRNDGSVTATGDGYYFQWFAIGN